MGKVSDGQPLEKLTIELALGDEREEEVSVGDWEPPFNVLVLVYTWQECWNESVKPILVSLEHFPSPPPLQAQIT